MIRKHVEEEFRPLSFMAGFTLEMLEISEPEENHGHGIERRLILPAAWMLKKNQENPFLPNLRKYANSSQKKCGAFWATPCGVDAFTMLWMARK